MMILLQSSDAISMFFFCILSIMFYAVFCTGTRKNKFCDKEKGDT